MGSISNHRMTGDENSGDGNSSDSQQGIPTSYPRWRTLYLHIGYCEGFHLIAHGQASVPGVPVRVFDVAIPSVNYRDVTEAMTAVWTMHPEGARSVRKLVCRPCVCFMSPYFLRRMRNQGVAVEYDEHLEFQQPRRPLRVIHQPNR